MTHAAVDLQKWGASKQVGRKKSQWGRKREGSKKFLLFSRNLIFSFEPFFSSSQKEPCASWGLLFDFGEEESIWGGAEGWWIEWVADFGKCATQFIPRHWGSPCGCSRVNYQRRACDSVWREILSIRGIRERTFNEIIRDLEYRILPSIRGIRVFAGTIRPSLIISHKKQCKKWISAPRSHHSYAKKI